MAPTLSGVTLPGASASSAGAPARLERYYFVGALALISALPFLLGAQPLTLVTAADAGILADEGDATKQVILGLVYAGFGALLLWRTRLRMILDLGVPLLLLLLLTFASALWSDLPFVTLRRGAALAGTVIIGLYAGLRFDIGELLELLCRVVAIVVIASFMVAALEPSLGLDSEGRFRGVFAHKNIFGLFAALGLLALLARLMQGGTRRVLTLYAFVAAGCVIGLALARSVAPLAALAFGLALLFWLRRSRANSPLAVVTVLSVAGVLGLVLPLLVRELGMLASLLGRSTDFSSRDQVWMFSIELFTRNPWLGYGYDTFWNGPAGVLFMRWSGFPVPHAHNGYLQLALDTGTVGVAVLLSALAVLLFRATRLLEAAERVPMAWLLAFVGLYLVSSIVETHLWSGNDLVTALFVYAVVRVNVLTNQAASPGGIRVPRHAFRANR